MGCMSSQKKFQRYRPKIEVQGKIFVFALFTREKGPYFNFVDFRAYFGPFSLVNRVEHKNLSRNVNLLSITLNFFCDLIQPKGMSG